MSYAKVEQWEAQKAQRWLGGLAAALMEGISFEAWSDARQNHTFKNRKGHLEASIRVEKKSESGGWVKYRLAAGVGGVRPKGGWTPYPQGRPGGVRQNTSKGVKYNPKIPYYAIFIELGTRKIAAMPFLLPSVLARRGDLERASGMASTSKVLGGV